MLVFGFLSIMLLIGIVLRAKAPFIQKFLFPSCLIGGVVGMILVNSGIVPIAVSDLELFAYHIFNISFISVGLTSGDNNSSDKKKKREALKGPLWMGLIQGIVFPLQAVIGGLFVMLFGFLGIKLFTTFGFLVPLGFNEGPGQALSFGKVWEGMGFEHGSTIGLTFAAIGFFFAFFVGVPIANWGIRKGLATNAPKELPKEVLTGVIPKGQKYETAGELTLHASNVDTIAFQAALVGLCYIITYLLVSFIGSLLGPGEARMVWGFFFFFGLMVAFVVKQVMKKADVDHLVDTGVQKRITGWSIDFLLVATLAAIQLVVVWKFIVPILVISLAAGIMTTWVILYFGRRLDAYNLERSVAIYGALTGNLSSGLLLLRVVDPDFKTPVAIEMAVMNLIAAVPVTLCTVLANMPVNVEMQWSLGTTLIVYACIALISLALFRVFKLWGPAKF